MILELLTRGRAAPAELDRDAFFARREQARLGAIRAAEALLDGDPALAGGTGLPAPVLEALAASPPEVPPNALGAALGPPESLPARSGARAEWRWRDWAWVHSAPLEPTRVRRLAWALDALAFTRSEIERRQRAPWAAVRYLPGEADDAAAEAWRAWGGSPWAARDRWERIYLPWLLRSARAVLRARRVPEAVRERVCDDLQEAFFHLLLGGADGSAGWRELAVRVIESTGDRGPVDALARRLDRADWARVGQGAARRERWGPTLAAAFPDLDGSAWGPSVEAGSGSGVGSGVRSAPSGSGGAASNDGSGAGAPAGDDSATTSGVSPASSASGRSFGFGPSTAAGDRSGGRSGPRASARASAPAGPGTTSAGSDRGSSPRGGPASAPGQSGSARSASARGAALARACAADPGQAERLLDLHVALRIVASWRDPAATRPERTWQIVTHNRGRARSRLRAVLAERADLVDLVTAVPALHARTAQAVLRYGRDLTWSQVSRGFSFDASARLDPPCDEAPIAMAVAPEVRAWVLLVVLKGRLDHLRRWIATGSTGDRDSTWGRLLAHDLPARHRPSLRATLALTLPEVLAELGPTIVRLSALSEAPGQSAFDAALDPVWHPDVPRPRVRYAAFVEQAKAHLARRAADADPT